MAICVMSSNGFLHSLDLRMLDLPGCTSRRRQRRIIRAIAHPDDDWTLCSADGRLWRVRLSGGWMLADGVLIGLRWRDLTGRTFAGLTSLRCQPDATGRRLRVRLRWPVRASAGQSG